MLQNSRTLASVALLLFAFSHSVNAQTQVLPDLQVQPNRVVSGNSIVLSAPPQLTGTKVRIGIFGLGQNSALDTETRVLTALTGNRAGVSVALEAEPGLYELRLLSNDKRGTPLTKSAQIIVPGIRREAGVWLFNGSPFIAQTDAPNPNGPPFLPNLRRDGKTKLPVSIPLAAGNNFGWKTLELPFLTTLATSNFDFTRMKSDLAIQIGGARENGTLVGWKLPARDGNQTQNLTNVEPTLKKLRAVLDAVSPGEALILSVNATSDATQAARDLEAAAALCDAVVLEMDDQKSSLWPIKVARRIAEEQPDFDLPIFVRTSGNGADKFYLDAMMSGATGLILPQNFRSDWVPIWMKNANLLTGAVTLEDAAITPSGSVQSARLFNDLRAAGRLPLVGRLPDDKKDAAESVLTVVDSSTSKADLEAIKRAATKGATLYLEGVPNLADADLKAAMGDLTSSEITVLPLASETVLKLEEPWLFGTARGLELPVLQTVKIVLKDTLAAQAKNERGLDKGTGPRVVASLNDSSPGAIVNFVGTGRIFWLPHRFAVGSETGRTRFYAAMAGTLGASLMDFRLATSNPNEQAGKPLPIHAALRATRVGGASILALFNEGNAPLELSVRLRGAAGFAQDLVSEKHIAVSTRGFISQANLTVPANGWSWTVWAESQEALEKERSARKLRAKLK